MAEDNTWQFNKSVVECNRHMLQNAIATDVTFHVSNIQTSETSEKEQGRTFHAHKYMLVSRSPVFYAMLCGDMAETGDITVYDVEPQAFEVMLNYIYTDEIDLKPHLVMFILHAAKKYLLPGLTSKCTKYLEENLNINNACAILDQSLIFDEQSLSKKCVDLIQTDTFDALNTESFTEIHTKTLSYILDMEKFTTKEENIFKSCLNWANVKCKEAEMEPNGQNMREILGECLHKIRFADIDIEVFGGLVGPSNILTSEEEIQLYRYISNKEANPKPDHFPSQSRYCPPGPHTLLTTCKTSTSRIGTCELWLTIYTNVDITITEFIIGLYHATNCNIQGTFQSTKTTLTSVTCGTETIKSMAINPTSDQKQDWVLEKSLSLKSGETKLILMFTNSLGHYFGADSSNASSQFTVITQDTLILNDEHVSVVLKSNRSFMPILGFKYILT